MDTRSASIPNFESVYAGRPGTRPEVDDGYASDTVRGNPDLSAHGHPVDLEIEINPIGRVDIDLSAFD